MRLLPVILLASLVALAGCSAPPPPATYAEPQLKYLLLDHYGEDRFFWCDPDIYPLSRGDEREKAIAAFPAIENDTPEFDAISTRLGAAPPYSDEEKLAIYREHKRLAAIPLTPGTAGSYDYSMTLGTEGQGRRVTGTISRDGAIRELRSEPAILSCPICLPAGTLIDTPAGPVPVEEVHAGTIVRTVNRDGTALAAPVLRTARARTPPGHAMVRVLLSDGRSVAASPGHPTATGRPIGKLAVGDSLDDAVIVSVTIEPYGGRYTYDLLPAGATGSYRADGVLLGSTLR